MMMALTAKLYHKFAFKENQTSSLALYEKIVKKYQLNRNKKQVQGKWITLHKKVFVRTLGISTWVISLHSPIIVHVILHF